MSSMSIPSLSTGERARYYQETSALYTKNGWDQLKRHWKYIRAPHEADNPKAEALTCIALGAFSGAIAGRCIGAQAEKIITRDPKSGEVGGFIGSGVGFVVGGCAGGFTYVKLKEHTPQFLKWKETQLDEAIKGAITLQYADDEVLCNFTCPITLCVMDIPAHTPGGVLYDCAYLANCPRDANNYIIDPNRNGSYPESAAVPDFETATVIQKRVRHLLKAEMAQIGDNPMLRKTLEKELRAVEEAVSNRYENARGAIEERRREKVIDHAQYKKEIEEFERIFGQDSDQDLSWTIDWKQVLAKRWKQFHPRDIVLSSHISTS